MSLSDSPNLEKNPSTASYRVENVSPRDKQLGGSSSEMVQNGSEKVKNGTKSSFKTTENDSTTFSTPKVSKQSITEKAPSDKHQSLSMRGQSPSIKEKPPSIRQNTPDKAGKVAIEPTNDTVDSQYRMRKLVRKHGGPAKSKYVLWFASHCIAVVSGLLYLVFVFILMSNRYYLQTLFYKLTIVGAILACMCTTSRRFGFALLPRFSMLAAQMNFQLVIFMSMWLVTFQSVFKIVPIILISMLQVAAEKKVSFVLKLQNVFSTVIAFNEFFLLVYLLFRAVFMMRTAGYQLVILISLIRLRILFDIQTAEFFAYFIDILDSKVAFLPNDKVRKSWNKLRKFIKNTLEQDAAQY